MLLNQTQGPAELQIALSDESEEQWCQGEEAKLGHLKVGGEHRSSTETLGSSSLEPKAVPERVIDAFF